MHYVVYKAINWGGGGGGHCTVTVDEQSAALFLQFRTQISGLRSRRRDLVK